MPMQIILIDRHDLHSLLDFMDLEQAEVGRSDSYVHESDEKL